MKKYKAIVTEDKDNYGITFWKEGKKKVICLAKKDLKKNNGRLRL